MKDFNSFYLACLLILFLFTCLVVVLAILYKRNKSKKNRFQIFSWNVISIIYLLFTFFFFGETYYRFYIDTTDSFAINKISQRWYKKHVQLNNFNVRDNTYYSYKIESGKRRVTIIGDSFSYGHGINDVEDRFSNILRNKYPHIEFHNISSPGANSETQLKTLYDLRRNGYQFDIILLSYCLNDIDYLTKDSKAIYERIHKFQNQLSYLEKESYFINQLSFRLFAFKSPDYKKYSDFVLEAYNDSSWDTQKQTLTDIANFTLFVNAKLKVITFPFLQKEIDSYEFKNTHKQITTFWNSKKIDHLDLLNVFRADLGKDLTVNEFDAHPNIKAHRLTAGALEKFLFAQ